MSDPLLALVRVLSSSAGEALVDADDRAPLVELVRAEMAKTPADDLAARRRALAAPLTVRAALIGEHVVEYFRAPDWWQARLTIGKHGGARIDVRWRNERATSWQGWGQPQPWEPMAALASPARLVPADQADVDPNTRGPL